MSLILLYQTLILKVKGKIHCLLHFDLVYINQVAMATIYRLYNITATMYIG